MRKNATLFVILIITIFLAGIFWFVFAQTSITDSIGNSFIEAGNNLAAVFFKESITVSGIKNKYNNSLYGPKVRVLVVPGHEPGEGGAEFGELRERDMAVELGNYLAGFLQKNGHYDTVLTRDNVAWSPVFSDYFSKNWDSIVAFAADQKMQMRSFLNLGLVATTTGAYHVDAPQDVALRLYGINKWANENNIDIEIHLHFNDYPRKRSMRPGDYSGFTIYVPEKQYSNSVTTKAIAAAVFGRLLKYNAVSDLETENAGVVEDQDLIAVGSNNNANAASLLIEYGYIYETQFKDPAIREIALRDMAYQTYLGLQDFFGQDGKHDAVYDTFALPYDWKNSVSKNNATVMKSDIFALQSALTIEGEFPAQGNTKNDCPRSGVFGPCTINALNAFQSKYDIKGETGVVGPKTREMLRSLYGY